MLAAPLAYVSSLAWTLLAVLGIMVMYNSHMQLAGAHQFAIQNRLSDSLLVDCQSAYRSNEEQEVWSGRRYVFGWLQEPMTPEDWVCGFSWLGTTFVKQFSVWNYTRIVAGQVCDSCEWKVDATGFSLKSDINKNQTFQFAYDWDASCLISSFTSRTKN